MGFDDLRREVEADDVQREFENAQEKKRSSDTPSEADIFMAELKARKHAQYEGTLDALDVNK